MNDPPDKDVSRAADAIRAGGLVGLPTETVYGLAADATNARAVARIYAAKGRPSFNPLIVHVADLGEAMRHAVFSEMALSLAGRFWPGPLTLVLPFKPGSPVCDLARAGLDSVALRVPAHPVARAIIKAAGVPIAAPSANRSGRISATTAPDVHHELGGHVDVVVDAGPASVGLESTIVALLDGAPRLLRPGGVTRDAIERVLGQRLALPLKDAGGPRVEPHRGTRRIVAGQHARRARELAAGEALLAFGAPFTADALVAAQVLNLSETGDMLEAAANLFSMLRQLDALSPSAIAVMPIPAAGLGEAINDRLARAAVR
jgi:L-threonylcarbamoyladenylate synthase